MAVRVKICGLTRAADARLAVDLGADALGFVLERTSPRFIGDEPPKWLLDLDPMIPRVAVFGRVDRAPHRTAFDIVQGAEWVEYPTAFARRFHTLRLRAGQRAEDFLHQTINASALLLDAYKEGQYGGTGHTVDWDLAAEIVQRSERPVILAGGLNPSNVAQAVRRLRPYAVDVSSGIESAPGIKDWDRLKEFLEAAKAA